MAATTSTLNSKQLDRTVWTNYRPGDLVMTRSGCPILCEVLSVLEDGLLRVRGLNWASGYSAIVDSQEMQPASARLL